MNYLISETLETLNNRMLYWFENLASLKSTEKMSYR